MKTISDFTIYCTESQTQIACELGAGIEMQEFVGGELDSDWCYGITTNFCYHIPTAEQMIRWLRTEGVHLSILYSKFRGLYSVQCVEFDGMYIRDDDGSIKYFISDKQATLAAIDAALDYLTNNKK